MGDGGRVLRRKTCSVDRLFSTERRWGLGKAEKQTEVSAAPGPPRVQEHRLCRADLSSPGSPDLLAFALESGIQ